MSFMLDDSQEKEKPSNPLIRSEVPVYMTFGVKFVEKFRFPLILLPKPVFVVFLSTLTFLVSSSHLK